MRSPRRKGRGAERSKALPKDDLLALRVEPEFAAGVDRFIAALRTQFPWVRLTRSDAVRWLLEDGLKRLGEEG
jgi:hypothetical protein